MHRLMSVLPPDDHGGVNEERENVMSAVRK